MPDEQFIKLVKHQVAESAVGASTLRNQGAKGLVKAAREHFKNVDLASYAACRTQEEFKRLLDADANALRDKFPVDARPWGAARKAMNVFLRDAFYSRYLFDHYDLSRIEPWLETPLDRDVATGLLRFNQNERLPKWKSIKELLSGESAQFQQAAQRVGADNGFAKVHVDLLYWRQRGDTGHG